MSFLRFLACASVLLLEACSCSGGEAPAAEFTGPTLDLLARRPDQVVEMPGAITPKGDVPGMSTFGASEGPGWSKIDHRREDGTPYRTTNQARAELILPATRPVSRELVFTLWCAHAAGEAPARVHLTLNEVELVPAGLALAREPAEVRVPTPAEAWRRGANRLELRVEPIESAGQRSWDALALARLVYGPEARAVLDPVKRTARLADGTGARYGLELAGPARLELVGSSSGAGVLAVRIGSMDPRTGTLEMEPGEGTLLRVERAGPLQARMPIVHRSGTVRLLELEWTAGAGAELTLSELGVREQEPRARPPIVFVSIDTFAAKHLALYGYPRGTSPELARFQRDAVLFERCLANAPWTLPSYLSVMSGLYPRAHTVALDFQPGAEIAPQDLWQLADNRWTLAEALRARGYRTGAFIDTQWLSPIFRVDQGFDHYNGEGALALFEDPHAHIEHIVERLVPPWLAAGDAAHPPFLFVHALDAHGPYLPDAPFRDAFLETLGEPRTHVPAGSDNQTYGAMPWWMSRTLQPDEKVPEAPTVPLEEVVARYDESLLKVDAYLGKLFAELRERGLYDQSVIVVSGDHGEFFGPGAYGHGLMQEAVLHVPLLVKLPGNAHGGLRVSTPVALVDVYPTLLELAGVAPQASRLHGTSLLAHLATAAPEPERALYSEGGHIEQYALTLGCWRLVEEFPGSESSDSAVLTHPRVPEAWLRANCPELLTQPLTKALLGELLARPDFAAKLRELRKLVAGPYVSLFDVCRDPEQRHDVAAAEPAELARLQAALASEKERSRLAQREARVSGQREPLSPQALEQLQGLGYGGGSGEDEH